MFEKKPVIFEKKNASFLLITLVFALSFATWTFRENGTFWEKNRVFLRKIRVLGPTRTLGEPFVENPTDLVPLSARLSKRENFWETSVAILDGILLTHTSVIGQQNINIQIKYKVIVSQVSVVMSQMAHRKCWKRNLQEALGQVANGKWFLQESLPISKFLKCFKKTVFF